LEELEKMLRQDDPRFAGTVNGAWIEKYGCAFVSVLFFVNKYRNIKLSPVKITIYLEQMKSAGCFDDNMNIIWVKAFKFFDIDVSVAVKDDPKYKLKRNEFAVAKWSYTNEKTGRTYNHFCPTYNGVCLFDPLGTSNCVEKGNVESYRVFKRK
jgi:hypothetical protein